LEEALIRFEFTRSEGDRQDTRNAKTRVQEFRFDVIRLRLEARLEGDEECDTAIRSANWELSKVGNKLKTAALASDITPTRTSTIPANLARDSFWESVSNSAPPTPGHVVHPTSPDDSIVIDTSSNPQNSLQVDAEMNDGNLNHSTNPPPPAATITPSCQR
jgi:hypothetical protein